MSKPTAPDAPVVIEVQGVHLSFPVVRYHARGIKEAFLALVRRQAVDPDKRRFWALTGVDMTVRRGEVVGILGRNGSGKSTLLRVVAGIYAPDKGAVRTEGRISSLLELGAGFRDELDGYENVRLSGAILGFDAKQIEALLPKIVEFSGLRDFMGQPLKTYSSGMRARLGFAVASNVEPDILLIDEALAVGDASFRDKSMARIEEMVADQDTTVIIVSHSAGELRRLCSRMLLLERGQVLMDGPVDEALARYETIIRAGAPVRAQA
jgi:ABC-type polysaccharide/polyol phosphate transport system ATPase subunit